LFRRNGIGSALGLHSLSKLAESQDADEQLFGAGQGKERRHTGIRPEPPALRDDIRIEKVAIEHG
jgi:hypothetical protein